MPPYHFNLLIFAVLLLYNEIFGFDLASGMAVKRERRQGRLQAGFGSPSTPKRKKIKKKQNMIDLCKAYDRLAARSDVYAGASGSSKLYFVGKIATEEEDHLDRALYSLRRVLRSHFDSLQPLLAAKELDWFRAPINTEVAVAKGEVLLSPYSDQSNSANSPLKLGFLPEIYEQNEQCFYVYRSTALDSVSSDEEVDR